MTAIDGHDPGAVFTLPRIAQLDDGQLADLFGVSRATIGRWRRGQRRMQTQVADRVAVRLGYHPANLWPESWR